MPRVVDSEELEWVRDVARKAAAGKDLSDIAEEKGVVRGTVNYRLLKAGCKPLISKSVEIIHEESGLPLEEAIERGYIQTPAENVESDTSEPVGVAA